MSHAALFVLLALFACKKEAEQQAATEPASQPAATPTEPKLPETAMTTPPSGWAQRTGPGFTVNAPGDATKSHADATDRDPAADIYTFHRTKEERYEVRVITATGSLSRAIATLRDRVSFSSIQIRSEAYLPEGIGDARGVDIHYVVSEDFESQFARSRFIATAGTVYHVRALFPRQREDDAAKFIESFALRGE
jgi:hypothetical protein